VPVILSLNYEANNALVYKFNNTIRNISAVGEHLSVFWPNLYCAFVETAFSELRGQNSDIAIRFGRFGDPDFKKDGNNLASRQRI